MDSDVQDWAETIRRCQPIANLRFEEPHAGNPLVRVCGGLGRVTAQGYPAEPTALPMFGVTQGPPNRRRRAELMPRGGSTLCYAYSSRLAPLQAGMDRVWRGDWGYEMVTSEQLGN